MWLRTIRAVMWSFLGIRKRSEYEQDAEQLNPVVLVVAGLVITLVFVLSLLMLVNLIV